jgi:hypothetical protein
MSLRRFALLPKTGAFIEMKETTASEMNELLTGKAGAQLGIPSYFDPAGRVWPKAGLGWVIVEELEQKEIDKKSAEAKAAEAKANEAKFAAEAKAADAKVAPAPGLWPTSNPQPQPTV